MPRKSKVFMVSVGGGIGVILAVATLAGFLIGSRNGVRAEESYEKLELLSDVLYTIQKNYVDETSSTDLIEGAIRGMVSSLDAYSAFLSRDEYQDIKVETKGKFGGLGIEVTILDGILTVVAPLEDTPASRAGIQAQDQIVLIDEVSTKGMTLAEAVKRLRGPKGTKVKIHIMREGFSEPKEITIVRAEINIKSVKRKEIEPGYFYLRIAQFQERTTNDLEKALMETISSGNSLRGIILDLRNNPGGLLEQAVEVADLFMEEGLIVYTEGRLDNQKLRFSATLNSKEKNWDCPMIILVNGGTASAAEIVTGALRDNNRAVALGTKTFGKGSVQTIIPMRDNTALRLTTAKYFTPSGKSIQGKGIDPDIEVPFVIPKRDQEKSEHPEEPSQIILPGEPGDPQFDRAWELLKSWEIFKETLSWKEPEFSQTPG